MIKKVPNPNIEEFEVTYISEGDKLENLESETFRLIDTASKEFFMNKESKMDEFLSSITFPSVQEWYELLLNKKCGLVILEQGKGNRLESPGGCYIVFQNDDENFESNEWEHSGSALDFEKKLYNPNSYYPELLDILKFSSVHFNQWYGFPKLIKLGQDNLAANNQWINPLLQELDIDELEKGKMRLRTMKRLLEELWLQSNDCSEPIKNMWFPIQEVAKSTSNSREEIQRYLNLLVNKRIIIRTSDEPLLYEFTEIGKELKADSEIEKIIKNVA